MNIKAIRTASGVSQIELALRSGISRSRLQSAEAGHTHLTPDEVAAITAVICEEPLRMSGEIRTALAATKNQERSQRS